MSQADLAVEVFCGPMLMRLHRACRHLMLDHRSPSQLHTSISWQMLEPCLAARGSTIPRTPGPGVS